MNPMRVARRRSRWGLLRVAIALCAVVSCCAVLMAAPPASASATRTPTGKSLSGAATAADPAKAAAATVKAFESQAFGSAGKAHTALNSAATGLPAQLTASFDFQDYSAAEMTAVVDYWWPESLGLPDNAPLGQLIHGSWALWQGQDPPSEWLPAQPQVGDYAGATINVVPDSGAGSIVTFTVPTPAGDVGVTTLPDIVVGILGQLSGALATVFSYAVCGAYAFGLPINDSGWNADFSKARAGAQKACTGLAASVAAIITVTTGWGITDTAPPDASTSFPWLKATGIMIITATGYYSPSYLPAAVKVLQWVWLGYAKWVKLGPATGILSWITPYLSPEQQSGLENMMLGMDFAEIPQFLAGGPVVIARMLGFWTPVASGYVGNVPAGGVVTTGSGQCMDAYGSNEDNEPASPPAVPGQSVAINVCNGNNAEFFNFWPGGQITIYGMCMDENGNNSVTNTPVVNLQYCDGRYSQEWYENGSGQIVNVATGYCLDDPASNTTPGTQLVVYGCNSQPNQLWAPPGGTAAITGYGKMYDVVPQSSSSYLCMMPQVTLSNPVGSNVITASTGSSGTDCVSDQNKHRAWARSADGYIFANDGMYGALCMDSAGPATTGPGGEAANFVQLELCNGSQSQVWRSVTTPFGPVLQDEADDRCITTQTGDLSGSVSMVVAACASPPGHGELWTLPGGSVPPLASGTGVCDIYLAGNTPCAAAYSMTRALYSAYNGALYQVKRASDNTTKNIGLLSQGGYVDASQQDGFCTGTTCTITEIFDQSPDKDDLTVEGPGQNGGQDNPASATALPIKVGNNIEAYGLDIEQSVGYRNNGPGGNKGAAGIATGNSPEGMYMVASGTHTNDQCCFDFGNAETDNADDGAGRMDAVTLSSRCKPGFTCDGPGPWVEDDLENGLFQGSTSNPNDSGNNSDFVTAMVKNNGTSTFALKGGDSHAGGLTTWYDGPLPSGYTMNLEGAITLGVGGDDSNKGVGSFFEGVMTQGYPSNATEDAVQQNIVQAGYSGNSAPTGSGEVTSQVAGPAVVHTAGSTTPGGTTSVFTVDAQNGHLQETYLPYMGADWLSHDLNTKASTPPVKPDTTPVAVVRCGFTGVFTVDASNNHLQETYLSADGASWVTQDMTAKYQVPPTKVTPTAVVHFTGATGASAACGYSSVFTIDASNGQLDETYLDLTGDPWHTRVLPTPPSQPGTSPVSLEHDGYTSVYTVGTDHHIYESHLKAIGDTWGVGDLTDLAVPPGPMTTTTLTAVYHDGYTTVFAVGDPLRHLFRLTLPSIGGTWDSQDLTNSAGTWPVAPGTAPVALFHTGYTTVYTVDEQSMHLQATYLPGPGQSWATHDLTAMSSGPPTTETPMVLVHPDETGALTRTSVFTINQFDNDLQDTALVAIGDDWTTQDLHFTGKAPPVMTHTSPTAGWSVAHDGYTSVFAVDPKNDNDLTESYLPSMGAAWGTHDLTQMTSSTTVLAGTMPVSLAWDGHIAAFWVGPRGDLWEAYLPATGGNWSAQDLTAVTGGQPTGVTPTAVFHGGEVDVYTVDDGGHSFGAGDLRQTYLPDGGGWATRDLSSVAQTPQVAPNTSPVALYHDGYTSVYTADYNSKDSGNDLQTTFQTAIGNAWQTQDLTQISGGQPMAPEVTPAALYHSGVVSLYTVDNGLDVAGSGSTTYVRGDLRTTFMTAIGDNWQTQDLSSTYHVPQVPIEFENCSECDPQTQNLMPIQNHLTALYHSGFASVYYLDIDNHVHATFLPAFGDDWQSQELPPPAAYDQVPPAPLVHYDANGGLTWTSLYTINNADETPEESNLPRIGDDWSSNSLPF